MTTIEWTDVTWNPTTGCDRVSPGCDHCYALTMAKRLKAMGSAKYQRDGDPKTSGPGFGVSVHEDALYLPMTWRKPKRVFVNSMSDLFHAEVPADFIARVFATMSMTRQHTYQILTKRHARMRSLLNSDAFADQVREALMDLAAYCGRKEPILPLPNVWLGVSVENQQWADIRIPVLLETPAAVRFLSCEPLLGPVDLQGPAVDGHRPKLTYWLSGRPGWADDDTLAVGPRIDWVIAGGESGTNARPMHPDWVRTLRDQCVAAGVPFHFKQWGAWAPWAPEDWSEDAGGANCVMLDGSTGWVAGNEDYLTNWSRIDGTQHIVSRVGKKAAGRELDGRTWDEYPAGAS